MSRFVRRALVVALALPLVAGSQSVTPPATPESARPLPVSHAVRASTAIVLDGKLTEKAWDLAPVTSSFTQVDPDEGRPASERTDVRVLYDDTYLYVGVRLHDRGAVTARLGRRDMDLGDSDWFGVMIDSYHDRRTAFGFDVNPLGVRRDEVKIINTDDNSWDPVWDVATSVDSGGWTAEYRIPFSQLRFSGAAVQEWGIQFERIIGRRHEYDTSTPMPKAEVGGVPKYGLLDGIARYPPGQATRTPPVCGGAGVLRRSGAGSVPVEPELRHVGRARPRAARLVEPHAQRRHQSRLRPGGGRSRGGEPRRLRDLLRGEAPAVHRRERRLRLRRQQHERGTALLFAPHRARAVAGGAERGERCARRHHHPGFGQALRQDRPVVDRAARCGDRSRDGALSHSAGERRHVRGRAARQLSRGAGASRVPAGTELRGGRAYQRDPRPLYRRRAGRAASIGARRRARLPARVGAAQLARLRRRGVQPSRRLARGDHGDAAEIEPLLPASRRDAPRGRLAGDVARRLLDECRDLAPGGNALARAGGRGIDEPRLRSERPRLRGADRSARRAGVDHLRGEPTRTAPPALVAHDGWPLGAQLRLAADPHLRHGAGQPHHDQLLVAELRRRSLLPGAGRSPHARRSARHHGRHGGSTRSTRRRTCASR